MLAYVEHLRGVGPTLRERCRRAQDLAAKIAQLQAELDLERRSIDAQVAAHWNAEEISAAKQEAK